MAPSSPQESLRSASPIDERDPSPTPSSASPPRKRTRRSKTGCLTCRLRKKRCDEARPHCATCTRLGLECMGYSEHRPGWMRNPQAVENVAEDMKKSMAASQSAKRGRMWSRRASQLRQAASEAGPSSAGPSSVGPSQFAFDPTDVSRYPLSPSQISPLPFSEPQPPPPPPPSEPEMEDVSVPNSSPGDLLNMPSAQHDALLSDLAQLMIPLPQAMGSSIDPALVNLLGPILHPAPQPAPSLSLTAFTASSDRMRYFHHYLTVIMPYQWIFERSALADLLTPFAFTNSVVFESLVALGALHMGKRRSLGAIMGDADGDIALAEGALSRSINALQTVPFREFGTHEMIIAAMSVCSFHLFDGCRPGWAKAVETCRRCLAAVMADERSVSSLGHLLAPLIWTDILASVTQGTGSSFVALYRNLLIDADPDPDSSMGKYLRETVMGCDSTTRLALAETIVLSEWKEQEERLGRLSVKDLLVRASAIERLLEQRPWSERHLFSPDLATQQRRAVSDVFFQSARVLLATVVNGPFPNVAEVAIAVQETAEAFCALDTLALDGADRALVFPTVIAGCHAATAEQQRFFEGRFSRLGDGAFGNTRAALRLMKEVWRRRESDVEVHWRNVMYEMDEEGLLLI